MCEHGLCSVKNIHVMAQSKDDKTLTKSHMCLEVHLPIRDEEYQGSLGSHAHGHPLGGF